MAVGDTVIKGREPDMTEDEFWGELRRLGSPVPEGDARGVYRFAVQPPYRLLPSALLGIFGAESGCGTDEDAICVGGGGVAEPTYSWGNTTEDNGKPSYGGTGRVVRGRFSVYDGWYRGGVSTVERLFKYGPYVPLRTVGQIIPVFAPKSENDTAAYIAKVEATIRRLGTKGGVTPVAPRKPKIIEQYIGVNIWRGRSGHPIESLFFHVAEGGRGGVTSWFKNPASQASAAGLACKNGDLILYARDEDTTWTNGVVNKPNMADPLIAKWVNQGINPNRRTLALETEGFHHEDMTPEQLETVAWWAATKTAAHRLPNDGSRLHGHNEIDSVNRGRCPSFSAREWDYIVAAVSGAQVANPIDIDDGKNGATNTGSTTYDQTTGLYIGGPLFDFYRERGGLEEFGHPIKPFVLYSDGVHRQLFENIVLEYYPDGTVKVGGLAHAALVPGGYPVWATAVPLLGAAALATLAAA